MDRGGRGEEGGEGGAIYSVSGSRRSVGEYNMCNSLPPERVVYSIDELDPAEHTQRRSNWDAYQALQEEAAAGQSKVTPTTPLHEVNIRISIKDRLIADEWRIDT